MMKKITLQFTLFLTFSLMMFSANAQSTYYEDFRYENVGRGFTVQKVVEGGQTSTEIGKRVGDIPDAADSGDLFVSRPVNRIPEGTARDQRAISFKNVSGSPADTNNAIEGWAIMTSQDLSSVNAPIVSFWTQQRYAVGGTSTLKIMVSTNYMHGNLPSAATWTDETANITGKIATSDLDAQTYVQGHLDLSAYDSSTVTVAFKSESNAVPYTDTEKNGTFLISDVNFQSTPINVSGGDITLNESSTGQLGIFDRPFPASGSEANFTVKYFERIFTTETFSTRFSPDIEIPTNEGVVFKVSDIYNPIKISALKFSIRNAHKEGYASLWKIEASNDGNSWTDVGGGTFTPIQDSNSDVTEETRAVDTGGNSYRYYRMVLAAEFPLVSNTGYIEFQEANFTVSGAVASVEDDILTAGVSIYPNPTNELLNIKTIDASIRVKDVVLMDVMGKIIYKSKSAKPINVSSFSKGIYFLKIASEEGGILSKKVIVD